MGKAEGSLIRKKFSFTEAEDWQQYGKLSARTEFSVLRKTHKFTHLHCVLHTGRTHQIRATVLALGFPLVGDKIYGVDESFLFHLSMEHLIMRIKSLCASNVRLCIVHY